MNYSIKACYNKARKSVVIRVFVDRKVVKTINTRMSINDNQWSEENREIIKHPNAKLMNQKIKNRINEVDAELSRADLLGVNLTPTRIKQIAEGKTVTTDFHKWAGQWVGEKYTNPETLRTYRGELNKVKEFAATLSFGDIDKNWLTRYENHLKVKLGNSDNTVWKSIKFIRTMCYDAGGLCPHNPFREKEYKAPAYANPDKDGLYISECDLIEKKVLLAPEVPVVVKIVAARFLLMCYSGLRISDAKRFNPDEHIIDGSHLKMKSIKTGVVLNLKLYDRLSRILQYVKELPKKRMPDQKFNEWLKVVQEVAGITRLTLTSHHGRHTWGCILAETNTPIDVAQKLMAHKDIRSTRIYYHLRQHKLDEAADRLNSL